MSELTLNQLITITYEMKDPQRRITLVIQDATEDDAATATADYAKGAFDIDDLLGSIWRSAVVDATDNGRTQRYTGDQFFSIDLLRELDGVQPTSVTFADLAPSA